MISLLILVALFILALLMCASCVWLAAGWVSTPRAGFLRALTAVALLIVVHFMVAVVASWLEHTYIDEQNTGQAAIYGFGILILTVTADILILRHVLRT